jgi:membrane-associated phospholipid phosphatase
VTAIKTNAELAHESRRTKISARMITELTTPALVNTVVPLVIGAHAGSIWWGLSVSICSGIVPFAGILAGMRARRVTDHHVTVRSERPFVMAFILASLGTGLAAQVIWHAPADVRALTAAMLATLLVLAAVTIAFRWKVSVHAAVAAGSAVMLAESLGAWATLTLLAVPAVMWSRVQVEDHSVRQVWAGAAVGLLVASLIFAALR